jgi:hypothetical protein
VYRTVITLCLPFIPRIQFEGVKDFNKFSTRAHAFVSRFSFYPSTLDPFMMMDDDAFAVLIGREGEAFRDHTQS